MRFFFHDMEKLYHRGRDGNNGNVVKTFCDSKNIFVNIIHWDRAIARTFQYSLLKSALEAIKKEPEVKFRCRAGPLNL